MSFRSPRFLWKSIHRFSTSAGDSYSSESHGLMEDGWIDWGGERRKIEREWKKELREWEKNKGNVRESQEAIKQEVQVWRGVLKNKWNREIQFRQKVKHGCNLQESERFGDKCAVVDWKGRRLWWLLASFKRTLYTFVDLTPHGCRAHSSNKKRKKKRRVHNKAQKLKCL